MPCFWNPCCMTDTKSLTCTRGLVWMQMWSTWFSALMGLTCTEVQPPSNADRARTDGNTEFETRTNFIITPLKHEICRRDGRHRDSTRADRARSIAKQRGEVVDERRAMATPSAFLKSS